MIRYETEGTLLNYHLEKNIDTFFSTHFKILLMGPYREMETDDSILLIAQKIII